MDSSNKLTVKAGNFDLNSFSNLVIDSKGSLLDPKKYDLLFIPYEKWGDREGPILSKDIFPFIEFLKVKHPTLHAEILIGLQDYHELGLHGSFKNFGKVYVAPTVLAVMVNIISSYMYDAMKNTDKPEARITIETQINNSNVTIYYSGHPEGLNKNVMAVTKKLSETPKTEWDKIYTEDAGKDDARACTKSDN